MIGLLSLSGPALLLRRPAVLAEHPLRLVVTSEVPTSATCQYVLTIISAFSHFAWPSKKATLLPPLWAV